MTGIRIAITGTPGVGKSTFCEQGDWATITVQELAKQHDCIEEIGEDGVAPIDVDLIDFKTPAAVTCNEAVNLANRYSDEQGRRMINGVLRKLQNSTLKIN